MEPWSVVWGVDKVGLQDQAMIGEFQDVKPPWPPAAKCPRGTADTKDQGRVSADLWMC